MEIPKKIEERETGGKEIRTFNFAFTEERKLEGHAAVFNEEADLYFFRESVSPGAFKTTIKKDDVRALFNHNPDYVLGRNTAKTLKMEEDERGLKVSISPPDTQFARDLQISIERGDISQMSFAFEVLEEEWIKSEKKNVLDLRKINKVKLYDVSPVTFPAYEGTDIALRSYENWKQRESDKQEQLTSDESGVSCFRRKLLNRR